MSPPIHPPFVPACFACNFSHNGYYFSHIGAYFLAAVRWLSCCPPKTGCPAIGNQQSATSNQRSAIGNSSRQLVGVAASVAAFPF